MQSINKFLCKMILATLLVLMSQLVNATSILQLDMNDLLQDAEFVFEGEVIASESRFSLSGDAINTYVTFEITDVISGDYALPTIELSFSGGSAQNLTMQVHGMIYPQLGETGIYFIEEIGRVFLNPLVGWSQGHFLIREDDQGAERMYTAGDAPIIEMDDQSAPAASISEGVATGVRAAGIRTPLPSQPIKALPKSDFKQYLSDKLSTQSTASQ